MRINDLTTADALPALEAMMRFAEQRNALINSNIANLDTPGYVTRDVSVPDFQRRLGEAIDDRRGRTGGTRGGLDIQRGREFEPGPDGRFALRPRTPSGNVLFHDRNERDLEGLMQDLVENTGAFRVAAQLYTNRINLLGQAISLRV
jgi:flagellar basal-body rod protein FlgB